MNRLSSVLHHRLDTWVENCLVALAGVVPEIPEGRLTKNLAAWRRGSSADLGGWLYRTPYFKKAYGLHYANYLGDYSLHLLKGYPVTADPGKEIFGDSEMFLPRTAAEAEQGDELHTIKMRLTNQLHRLIYAQER